MPRISFVSLLSQLLIFFYLSYSCLAFKRLAFIDAPPRFDAVEPHHADRHGGSAAAKSGKRSLRPTIWREMTPTSDKDDSSRRIVVESEILLPFSADIAYDAFADLPRQPSWSPWLTSVEYIDDDCLETKWTMSYLGVRLSWHAISTCNQRPLLIKWESTKGMRNEGRVDFSQKESSTHMKVTMTFHAPRVLTRLFRSSNAIKRAVERRMLQSMLENFRAVVMEQDIKERKRQLDLAEKQRLGG